jgi:DHA2 family multidrug resistance protein
MVVFRLLQGMFGAPLVPLSQVVLLDAYPRERHGSAMAMWGIGVMVGPILGPFLGGYLTECYDWRWVFYVNLPVGLLALLGLATFLSETESNQEMRFDWFGFAMLSVSLGALQLMLDRGEQLDWFNSNEIIWEAVLTGLAAWMFVVHTATVDRPFIDPRLFLDRNFNTGLALITTVGMILFATLALLTPFIENVLNYPVMTTGVVLAPRGIGTMVAMIVVGRVINRTDSRLIILLGLGLTALSLYQMTGFSGDVSEATLISTGIVQGLGLGFVFVPLSAVTFATLASSLRPQATGLFSLMRNIGSSIGISYVIFLLSHNTRLLHAQIVESVTPFDLPTRLSTPTGLPVLWGDPGALAARAVLDAEITRQATIIAYLDDFKLLMIIAVISMPLVLLLQRARPAPVKP